MKKYIIIPVFITVSAAFLLMDTTKGQQRRDADTAAKKPDKMSHFALVEIFTSEGCSSCPPAYKVVNSLVSQGRLNHQKVILLDFHVDYFNNMGWVDSFSRKQFTDRQEDYSRIFPSAGVYTPQLVVNGTYEGLASDTKVAGDAIARALEIPQDASVSITSVKTDHDSVRIRYKTGNIAKTDRLMLAIVQPEVTVNVSGGENKGRTITHRNIVKSLRMINAATGRQQYVSVSAREIPAGGYSIVVFAQDPEHLNIKAADQSEQP